MGTRNLTVVIANGQHKIAQYGQWDGYPSGQGAIVLEFLQNADLDSFKERLNHVRFGNEEDIKAAWRDTGVELDDSGFVSLDVANRFSEIHPELSRDTGADILNIVANSTNELILKDSLNFAADSLFCEYAYVVDLDNNRLEVYKGFNQKPLTPADRFYTLSENVDQAHRNEKYLPVVKAIEFDLNALPSEEEFVKQADEACGD